MDYFIGGEYTYKLDKHKEKTLDEKIMNKVKYCDIDKKKTHFENDWFAIINMNKRFQAESSSNTPSASSRWWAGAQ